MGADLSLVGMNFPGWGAKVGGRGGEMTGHICSTKGKKGQHVNCAPMCHAFTPVQRKDITLFSPGGRRKMWMLLFLCFTKKEMQAQIELGSRSV